jgi:hypothetical protein
MNAVTVRANEILERVRRLDDAVAQLCFYRNLLEDLNSRLPIHLPADHFYAVCDVRAAVLRSAIGLSVAVLDSTDSRGNRASVGHIVQLLKDQHVVDYLSENDLNRKQKLNDAKVHYDRVFREPLVKRVQGLRHNEIAHLLIRKIPDLPVEYTDVFTLADQVETLVLTLHEGVGWVPHFVESKNKATERAMLFWQAYFAGVNSPT